MYRLFDEFAHRYDWHTPPLHYRHDHAFVLEWVRAWGHPCHLLDVGCGTGSFLEKARQEGLVTTGIDAAPGMIKVVEQRLGPGIARVRRMQELDEEHAYDAIVSLSWTLNYCESWEELREVLRRFHRALRPGGGMVLQVAHAPHAPREVLEDREPGPGGEPEDVLFLYHFQPMGDTLSAEYVYACKSAGELLHEKHLLRVADARAVADCAREAGFTEVELFDSFQRQAFHRSVSPFLVGRKVRAARP